MGASTGAHIGLKRSTMAPTKPTTMNPIAATEAIAYDFLSKGGKHSRPFITLAVYDALTGGKGTQADGAEQAARWLARELGLA